MELVTIESQAFQLLFEKLIAFIRAEHKETHDRWVGTDEAMRLLRIKSKTTLQKIRDQGLVRFSQPEVGGILYDVLSIHEYLEKHSKETF